MRKTVLFIIMLFLIPAVFGWGISYSNTNFVLKKGQTQEVTFSLQNYVGDEVKRIIIKLEGDNEIAKIKDAKDYYILPPKTKDYPLVLVLSIPEDKAKTEYNVEVDFIAYPYGSGVSIASGKSVKFNVKVPDGDPNLKSEPKKEESLQDAYANIDKKIAESEHIKKQEKQNIVVGESQISELRFWGVGVLVLAVAAGVLIYFRQRRKKLYEKML